MLRMLAIGMKGPDVAILQSRLNACPPSAMAPLSIDGIFWSKSQARVKEFQQANQLKTDGIVGPHTWGKLLEDPPDPSDSALSCDPSCDNSNSIHLASLSEVALPAASVASGTVVASGSSAPSSLLGFTLPKLPSLPKIPSLPKLRPYAGSPEEAIGKSIYGSSIDSSTVYLSDKTGIGNRAFTLAVPGTVLTAAQQIMNVGPPSPGPFYHDTIVHELAHVWQSQHATSPTQYMVNAVESQGLAEAANRLLKVKSFSAYGYRPGKKFSEYAAEQIAEQCENGETAIIAHMVAIAPGKVDPDNDVGLSTARLEDTSLPGVKK
ncbi:MAG: peptidoglycan-binding domain-containing protein [Candidatus Sulfotelmatobacter sp.]